MNASLYDSITMSVLASCEPDMQSNAVAMIPLAEPDGSNGQWVNINLCHVGKHLSSGQTCAARIGAESGRPTASGAGGF